MKRKIYLGLLFIITFLVNLQVNAIQSCTNTEMERLRELAKNFKIQTSYEMDVDDENKSLYLEYSIKFINFDPDLKIIYQLDSESDPIELTSTSEFEDIFSENSKVDFKIYSYTNNLCTERLLKTYIVNFPSYNDYYYFNKEKCDANSDFKYCKEFMNVEDIDFEKIDKEFDEYLKEDNINSKITNNLLWYIIGGLVGIVVLITIIVLIVKRKKKTDDF